MRQAGPPCLAHDLHHGHGHLELSFCGDVSHSSSQGIIFVCAKECGLILLICHGVIWGNNGRARLIFGSVYIDAGGTS